jgi:two-component system response regulator AtoC
MATNKNDKKPDVPAPKPEIEGPGATAPGVSGKRAYDRTSYILVVDDDNTLLKFFKIHLNKFFSRVIVVKNAKEAIDTLREKEIDLVLSDIRMPRMDGLQLMKRVRKHDSAIPMLLISGALLTEEQSKGAEEDADGYLRKPFSVDDLHQFLDQGMALREKYKKLADCLTDKKNFRELLHGKGKVEKLTPADKRAEAIEILEELKASEPKKAS